MKKIVIMGATSGIGLRIAEKMAEKGWLVGACGRKKESLEALKEKYPENVETAVIDITKEKAPETLMELIEKMDGMDVYFHCSGIGYNNITLDPKKELNTLKTNVLGFGRMLIAAYSYFRDTKRKGKIAAITSVAGTNGIGTAASYSSSKRFQQTYLRALNQLATIDRLDLKFVDIRPGWVRTPLLKADEKYPMEMTLEYVTPRILKALMGKRRVHVIDWRWSILVALWRLIPNSLWVKLPLSISDMGAN